MYQILAYGFGQPGKTAGKLSTVFAECDHYYTTHGVRHDDYEYAGWMAPVSSFGLVANSGASSTSSLGIMQFTTGSDPYSFDSASVSGKQIADNTTDTNVSGGLTVHLKGKLHTSLGLIPNQSLSCSTSKMPAGTASGTENTYEPVNVSAPYFYTD